MELGVKDGNRRGRRRRESPGLWAGKQATMAGALSDLFTPRTSSVYQAGDSSRDRKERVGSEGIWEKEEQKCKDRLYQE